MMEISFGGLVPRVVLVSSTAFRMTDRFYYAGESIADSLSEPPLLSPVAHNLLSFRALEWNLIINCF